MSKEIKMIDMQLSNDKLQSRAEKIVIDITGADINLVRTQLKIHSSVRKAIDEINKINFFTQKIIFIKYNI